MSGYVTGADTRPLCFEGERMNPAFDVGEIQGVSTDRHDAGDIA